MFLYWFLKVVSKGLALILMCVALKHTFEQMFVFHVQGLLVLYWIDQNKE